MTWITQVLDDQITLHLTPPGEDPQWIIIEEWSGDLYACWYTILKVNATACQHVWSPSDWIPTSSNDPEEEGADAFLTRIKSNFEAFLLQQQL